MFANERRTEIVKQLEQQQTLTVAELMERYNVSIETIRRDLAYLEELHLLKRVHGGAISLNKQQQFMKLEERVNCNHEDKQETAQTVISLIEDGDRICLDSGSTALEIALLLREQFHKLTVITYSSEIFQILSQNEQFELIQIGGAYLQSEQAFHGYLAEEMLSGLRAQKAILCPSAVSLETGLSDYIPELIPMQRLLTKCADHVIVAADSNKLNTTGMYRICPLNPSFCIATDHKADKAFIASCQSKEIQLKLSKK